MGRLRILFFGAGVIGSFYAARLCGMHDVTLLARGKRLEFLRENGLILCNEDNGETEKHNVKVIGKLAPDDCYDYVFVTLRCQQAPEILPVLQANCSRRFVFMMNGVESYDTWRDAIKNRLLTAFPIVGGEIREGVVHYASGLDKKGKWHPTFMGTPDNTDSPALKALVQVFTESGLPVKIIRPMRDFHFVHVGLVSPIANALYACGGSNYELAKNPDTVRDLILSVRENFRALQKKGIRIVPEYLKLLYYIPLWLAVPAACKMIGTPHVETIAAKHARNAKDEMAYLYRDLMGYLKDTEMEMPASGRLSKYLQ